MDDAHEVRAELRSYALRRCIRFYSALVIVAIAWNAGTGMALSGGSILLVIIAGVELASWVVMRDMAAARERLGGGPETRLWRFAQGPHPSLLAAALFLVAAWWLRSAVP